jgi:hypothetical protein
MSRHNSPIAILAFGAVQTHNDGVLISSTREAGRKFQRREKVPAEITIEKKTAGDFVSGRCGIRESDSR